MNKLQRWKRIYCKFFKKGYEALENIVKEDQDEEDRRLDRSWQYVFNYISQSPSQFNKALYFTPEPITQCNPKDSDDSK